jgi:hypothetical protein
MKTLNDIVFEKIIKKTKLVKETGCLECKMNVNMIIEYKSVKYYAPTVLFNKYKESVCINPNQKVIRTCSNKLCYNIKHIESKSVNDIVFEKVMEKTKLVESGCLEWIGYASESGSNMIIEYETEKYSVSNVVFVKYKEINSIDLQQEIIRTCSNKLCFNFKHMIVENRSLNDILFDKIMGTVKKSPNGCLEWTGSLYKRSYDTKTDAQVSYKSKKYVVSTVVFNKFKDCANDTINVEQKIVRTCSNVLCCNLDHISFESTNEKMWQDLLSRSESFEGCLLFKGIKNKRKYMSYMFNKKNTAVHRISYEIWNGKIPEKMIIRHKCKNKNCFKPSHLELGDYFDNNNKDKRRDGTLLIGEKAPSAKLTEQQVIEILKLIKLKSMSIKDIALHFDVTTTTINCIKNGTTWSHLCDDIRKLENGNKLVEIKQEKYKLQKAKSKTKIRLAGLTTAGSMMYSKTRLRRFDKQQSCLASWNHS